MAQFRDLAVAGARRLATRLASGLLVLWVSVTLTFLALQVVPGDPVKIIAGPGAVLTPDAVAALRQQFGLDQPAVERYLHYLLGLAHGNLGMSYESQQPVTTLIFGQLGSSVALTLAALSVAWIVALLGILLTAARSPVWGGLGRGFEVITSALPDFWLGLLLITAFSFKLHWFPAIGRGLSGLILPALALGIPLAGFLGQITRQSFEDAMAQPFALSVQARGASDLRLRLRHALRHALLPGIALSNWSVGWLLGASVAIEQIFARRGLGALILEAVQRRDFPIIMGSVVLIALVYVLVNIVTDGLTFLVDRRSQAGEARA
ncbi:ABC transporter permease [Acidisoma silvae]|uniref:ABC transporter permease n=1 Tax=Acidisoma silvae TaxID=2802396 RepID=A0A964E0G8_9PROT|nr:ABC transporter permease [Acidisoma silvae]MCB8877500.1 ABC transporter permease [Acidisoma silvae]